MRYLVWQATAAILSHPVHACLVSYPHRGKLIPAAARADVLPVLVGNRFLSVTRVCPTGGNIPRSVQHVDRGRLVERVAECDVVAGVGGVRDVVAADDGVDLEGDFVGVEAVVADAADEAVVAQAAD